MLSVAALLGAPAWALLILGLGWVGCVAWFAFLPVVYTPRLFKMYGNPWSASAALLANLHLICESRFSPHASSLLTHPHSRIANKEASPFGLMSEPTASSVV